MKKGLKIVSFILVGLVIILVFLNPNTASFKNYARNFGDPEYIIYKKTANYFLFSIYIKQNYREIEKYYGVAGNFFKVENNTDDTQTAGIVSKDSVTAVADSAKKELTDTLDYGPNAHIWMDDLGAYFNQNPNATDEELYKKFPQLDHNEKRLMEGVSYDQAKKEKGMTDYKLQSLFPELFRDELYYQWHK
jgi:hypothetical protein